MTLLEIDNLWIRLPEDRAARPILSGVTLGVAQGEIVGLVGESGSGKSVTCRAVLGQLPESARATGGVRLTGRDMLTARRGTLREMRSREVGMVFQDPRAAVDPLHRIGHFVTESLRSNLGYNRHRARQRAVELLAEVGIAQPERALDRWPHEFSGGMLQRVVIAAALAGDPRLLLADEATTALDVTTQAEVVALLKQLAADRDMGVLFVTHDLELAAAMCDRVYVMYAGQVVESAATDTLFDAPAHPYTVALMRSTPRLTGDRKIPEPIPGRPSSLAETTPGCPFAPRCTHALSRCDTDYPEPDGRPVGSACIRSGELADELSHKVHAGKEAPRWR